MEMIKKYKESSLTLRIISNFLYWDMKSHIFRCNSNQNKVGVELSSGLSEVQHT